MEWDDEHPRTQTLRDRETKEGRKESTRKTGYHRRSLSETAMSCYKTQIGPELCARLFETQQVEAYAAVAVTNRIQYPRHAKKGLKAQEHWHAGPKRSPKKSMRLFRLIGRQRRDDNEV